LADWRRPYLKRSFRSDQHRVTHWLPLIESCDGLDVCDMRGSRCTRASIAFLVSAVPGEEVGVLRMRSARLWLSIDPGVMHDWGTTSIPDPKVVCLFPLAVPKRAREPVNLRFRSSLVTTSPRRTRMADPQFIDIWQKALIQYRTDTNVVLSATDNDADSPDAVLALIDKHQKAFEAYRKKGRRVRNALEPVLCLVRSFSQVAGEGVGLVSIINRYIHIHCLILSMPVSHFHQQRLFSPLFPRCSW
jgi:hypothetical protein